MFCFSGFMPSLWSKCSIKLSFEPLFENINVLPLGGKSSDEKYHLSKCQVGL